MSTNVSELTRLVCAPDALARIGQALWMRIGQGLSKRDLIWAKGLLGDTGDEILWAALGETGVVRAPDWVVDAGRLAVLLRILAQRGQHDDCTPHIVWTLPEALGELRLDDRYDSAVLQLIGHAHEELIVVSPFLEARGIGVLLEALLGALKRGVQVIVVTHGATDLSSHASAALEQLRHEASGLSGGLSVYSASSLQAMLLHSKIVISDNQRVILGSANLTGPGLGSNLEAGVVLGESEARTVHAVVNQLLASKLVTRAFATKDADSEPR